MYKNLCGIGFFCYLIWSGHWLEGKAPVLSQFSAYSRDLLRGDMEVAVGLDGLQLQLHGNVNCSEISRLHRVSWEPDSNQHLLKTALRAGLSYPELTAVEYVQQWAGRLAEAGHHAATFLWAAFVVWVLYCTVYLIDIAQSHYFLLGSGILLTLASLIFHALQPPGTLEITLGERNLVLRYGPPIYVAILAGISSMSISLRLISRSKVASASTERGVSFSNGLQTYRRRKG